MGDDKMDQDNTALESDELELADMAFRAALKKTGMDEYAKRVKNCMTENMPMRMGIRTLDVSGG